jgi:hypothetical protein
MRVLLVEGSSAGRSCPVAHELNILTRSNRARHARRVANLRLQGIRGDPLAAMVEKKRSVARSTQLQSQPEQDSSALARTGEAN